MKECDLLQERKVCNLSLTLYQFLVYESTYFFVNLQVDKIYTDEQLEDVLKL